MYVGEAPARQDASIGENSAGAAHPVRSQGPGERSTDSAKIAEATVGGGSATNFIVHVSAVGRRRRTRSPLACGLIVAK